MLDRLFRRRRASHAAPSTRLTVQQLEDRDVPAVWYVSPTGSDAAPGTADKPVATVAAVAWQLQPGDEVHFRAGTYRLTAPVALYKSGTAAAPIKVMAEPGEAAVLDGSTLPAGTNSLIGITGDYVQVSGLRVVGSPRIGIAAWGASHVAIRGNTVTDSQGSGIYVGYDRSGVVSDVAIEGNTVFHNSLSNSARSAQSGWPAAVVAQYTTGARFVGNTVYENYGEGIDVVLSDGAVVTKNVARDNFGVNYYLDNVTRSTVDGNLSTTTNNPNYYRFGRPATGIEVANEVYATANKSSDLRITNNLLLGGMYGFYYCRDGFGGGLRNVLFANNTIYGSVAASMRIDGDRHSGTVFANNIFEQHAGYAMVDYNGADGRGGLTFRSNLWYGGTPEVGASATDVRAKPLFVAPGGSDPAGYRLRADSPAVGRGTSVAVASDYFGGTRLLTTPDIGAIGR